MNSQPLMTLPRFSYIRARAEAGVLRIAEPVVGYARLCASDDASGALT